MAKEKSTTELKDAITQLEKRKNELIEKGKVENRKLNEAENTELGDIAMRMADAEFDMRLIEARNKRRPNVEVRNSGYSLLGAIRETVEGRGLSDKSIELIEAGRAEMRSSGVSAAGQIVVPMEMRGDNIQATISGDGKETVPDMMLNLMGPLREKLVLVEAGASFLTGLNGNILIPKYSGSSAQWEGEVATAKNGKGEFSKITMSPKRIASTLYVSKQFLIQDSQSTDAMLRNDIVNAVASKLQSTIFGSHDHADTMPDGFFTGTPAYTVKGAATFGSMVDLETAVDSDMALYGNLSYVMHTGARGILKKTLKAANVAEGFIYEDKMVNGYKTLVTKGMASGLQTEKDEFGIIFGNWADLIIGQWGALDITVDPFSKSEDGLVKLVINAFFDVVKRRDESFAIGSIK